MPQFEPGESKTAVVPMTNPTAKPFDYEGALYMGTDLVVMSQVPFRLEAGEQRGVSFPVIMPSAPGTYPVSVGVSVAGKSIALREAVEDVVIVAPVPLIVSVAGAYLREDDPRVSEAFSGWMGYTVGGELNLGLFGSYIQAGVVVLNASVVPVVLDFEAWNYHWTTEGYVTDMLVLPSFQPQRFPPAPTGLLYSSYEYGADKFCPPGTTLQPGETGFVYTSLYRQSRRWNNVYLKVYANEQEIGTWLLYHGWYSY